MKKLFSILIMSLVLLVVPIITPLGNSAASAAGTTYTLPYGERSIINQVNAGDIQNTPLPGWAKLNILTYVTLNDQGVTITKVTQGNSHAWPYSVVDKGTGIIRKTSSNISQTAHSYGKFYVGWNPTTRYVPIGLNRTWELHTYIKVKAINKTKRTVTFESENKRFY